MVFLAFRHGKAKSDWATGHGLDNIMNCRSCVCNKYSMLTLQALLCYFKSAPLHPREIKVDPGEVEMWGLMGGGACR